MHIEAETIGYTGLQSLFREATRPTQRLLSMIPRKPPPLFWQGLKRNGNNI